MSVVEDFDLDDLGLTWREVKYFLGLFLTEGASLLPALFALEVPLLAAFLHLLFPILGSHFFASHLVHKFLHHLTEGLAALRLLACIALAELADEIFDHVTKTLTTVTTSTSAATTTTSPSAVLTSVGECMHHLVNELRRVFGLFLLDNRIFFFKHGNHDVWGASSLADLEEGMFMTQTLFAVSAVVEVFADTALVAQPADRFGATAVTANALMDSLSVF